MSFVLPPDVVAPSPSGRRSVLVVDGDNGQSRSALAAVRALARGSITVVVATAARFSLAAASNTCSQRVVIPPSDAEDHADAVLAALVRGSHLAALPSSDASLTALGAPGSKLLDKHALARRAADAGLQPVAGQLFRSAKELLAAASHLDYPCVVKPETPSVPAARADTASDVGRFAHVSGSVLVQPYIDGPMSAVAGLVWDGELVQAVHQRYLRTWPYPCGTASAAVTVTPDPVLEERLLALLAGYRGLFQAQFVDAHLIDLNPRVYGSLPLALAAGVNPTAGLCDLLSGRPVPSGRARAGTHYRWLEGDLRHLASGVRAGRMGGLALARALSPRRGSAHSVASRRDLAPAIARVRYVATSRSSP